MDERIQMRGMRRAKSIVYKLDEMKKEDQERYIVLGATPRFSLRARLGSSASAMRSHLHIIVDKCFFLLICLPFGA